MDGVTSVANFADQELIIPMGTSSKNTTGSSSNNAEQESNHSHVRENLVLNLKLMAVNEQKQKLIGLYQLKVHMKNFDGIDHKRVTFDKCIDKEGAITFSASLQSFLKAKAQNTHRGHENSIFVALSSSDQ